MLLTAAGKRLLPYVERIGRLVEDARRAAVDDGEPAGPLVIGALETTAALHCRRALGGAHAQRLISIMTVSFGAGQMAGPRVAGMLAESTRSLRCRR